MTSLARRIRSPFAIAILSLASMVVGHSETCVIAKDPADVASLKMAPIDADFFSASFRLREQWDRFVSGPVVKEFLESSGVENAMDQFRSEWLERDGVGMTARTFFENPNTKDALAFIQDLLSTEVFFVGDKNVSQWYEAQGNLSDEMRSQSLSTKETEEERALAVFAKYLEKMDSLTIPTVVIGARCQDEDLALGKLDQLEGVLQLGRGFVPNLDLVLKNLDRVDDARGNRLQLRLDGTQIPWDSIPTNESFDEEAKDNVQEVLDKKSITITIGMLDGFFVVGISPSSKAILELGKGKSILEHPEMQPVRDASSRPLISVSYTSDAMAKATFAANFNNFFSRSFTGNITPILQSLDDASEIRDFVEDLVADCLWVDESIAKLIPEFKGTTSLAYLTDDGWERHDYSRTENILTQASSPLISLEHMGDAPMMFVATRLQDRPEYFQLSRKIVQKLKTRLDEACELDWSEMDLTDIQAIANSVIPGEWSSIEESLAMENIQTCTDLIWPHLVRLADTWEKKFLPAMTGEHAMLLTGGNLSAKQWFKDMPPSVDPLPFPEFAAVTGVKDKSLLRNAFEDTLTICDELVMSLREKAPNAIPADYQVPRPIKSETSLGVKYGYAIPADCPVPKEMMPQVLFSGDFLFDSYSDKQSAEMAGVRKLSVGVGIIDSSAKQSSASYIHVGRVFDFARPWIRYVLTETMESMEESLLDESLNANYELTGKDLLSAWGVLSKLGEFSSVTSPLPNGGSHVRSVYKSQKME